MTAPHADHRLAGLLAAIVAARPDADAELIGRAYRVAAHVHAGQVRKSGDPYISHPVAVAAVLAGNGADDQALCAALLHDTLDDGSYALADLRGEFGADIAGLVTGVSALEEDCGSLPADARVLLIKLADRLHNMRTVGHLPQATQLSKSRQTLDVLVPLAGRLGLEEIRAELADLAAATLSRNTGPAPASGALLAAAAVLLPRAARSRWREEWLGELRALPTRRQRAVFAARTLPGIARLAATLRRPRPGARDR